SCIPPGRHRGRARAAHPGRADRASAGDRPRGARRIRRGGPAPGRVRPAARVSTGSKGVTLVELLVVLVILAILGSLSGAALWSLKVPPADSTLALLDAARRQAIRLGTP